MALVTEAGPGTAHLRPAETAMLRVEHLVVEFLSTGGKVHAVSDVSFDVAPGETLGLVGESGCGKSTSGRAVVQLPRPTSGSVRFEDHELTAMSTKALRAIRPRLQMIFQDPISSLNPRRRVFDIVAEPLAIAGIKDGVRHRVNSLLEQVGLDPDAGERRPHQFSGGQCQRISIARALMLEPKLLICDEPVSALDVSVQAQILNLLEDMKTTYGLTMVFIAHDLAVVKNVSDRVAVMYLGKLCEVSPADELYRSPRHPYTAALLASIPIPDPASRQAAGTSLRLSGDLPSPVAPPSGCRFRTRCPRAQPRCAEEEPVMRQLSDGHFAACHFPLDVAPSEAGAGPAG
jgi:peptide/nickel transport system ATP-binding protein